MKENFAKIWEFQSRWEWRLLAADSVVSADVHNSVFHFLDTLIISGCFKSNKL
jgi:hypothetical protein